MLLNYCTRSMATTAWRRYAVIAFVVLFSCSLNAASVNLAATVIDSEGASVGKAHIIIRPDASGRRDARTRSDIVLQTDTHGRFGVQLSTGFYDVCVMADAFTPYCQKIFVNNRPLNPKIQLKADPEVMKRLGDAF
jgi:hypothetical protein